MLNDLEADTAEYILSKFGLIMVMLKENKYGFSVSGQFRGNTSDDCWKKFHQVVADTRIRLPGAFIGGEPVKASEGYIMIVEIY